MGQTKLDRGLYSLNREDVMLLNFGAKEANGMAYFSLWVSFSLLPNNIYCIVRPF